MDRTAQGPSGVIIIIILIRCSQPGQFDTNVDKQCNAVKNPDGNSTAVFGGLPVVIVLGDMHQFSPVRAKALWQKQESPSEIRGQQIWHMFKDVVLDQQMRQQQDVQYHQLLQRARNGILTQADVDLLNTRVVTELDSLPDLFDACTAAAWVVRTNKLRHAINRVPIESFARSPGQKILPSAPYTMEEGQGSARSGHR
jgi:hypothetical protein